MVKKDKRSRIPELIGIFAFCILLNPLGSHVRNQSFSNFTFGLKNSQNVIDVTATFTVAKTHVREHFDQKSLLKQLNKSVRILAKQPCQKKIVPIQAAPEYYRFELSFQCNASKSFKVENRFLTQSISGHLHFATFYAFSKRFEFIFNKDQHQFVLQTDSSSKQSQAGFIDYLLLGFKHILIGADHLAFLLALLLIEIKPRRIAILVTGFTIGHSASLITASTSSLVLNMPLIEAFIALTIIIVALRKGANRLHGVVLFSLLLIIAMYTGIFDHKLQVALALLGMALLSLFYFEANLQENPWLHATLTTCFGFLHGFGFASVLQDIGLAKENLLVALAGFNIGIELGQLLALAPALLLLMLLHKKFNRATKPLNQMIQFSLLVAGSYWFFDRLFF